MCIFFSLVNVFYPHCPKLRELESKKWRFTNFVVGGEVVHVCVLMSLGVGRITEEKTAQNVLRFKTL